MTPERVDSYDWNERNIRRLREMWLKGMTTGEIGEAMGISRNAVIGKAHRLELPARPSPIKRLAHGEQPKKRVYKPRTRKPAMQSVQEVAEVVEAPPRPTPPPVPSPPVPRARECQWPIGEPREPGFRFCGCDTVGARPYCAEHLAVAYVTKVAA